MVCTVTSKARNYTLKTTYSTDPARDTVLVKTDLQGKGDLKLYVRLDPTSAGTAAAGPRTRARIPRPPTATPCRRRHDDRDRGGQPRLREADLPRTAGRQALHQGERGLRADRQRWAHPARHRPQADGVRQRAQRERRPHRGAAQAGHPRARVRPHRRPARAQAADRSLDTPYFLSLGRYLLEWALYDAKLERPSPQARRRLLPRHQRGQSVRGQGVPGRRRRRPRVAVGPGRPAGNLQDGKAPYFGSYREVFSRDLYEAFTALLVAGDDDTARTPPASCSSASSWRTAGSRATACSTARRRRTPAATSSTRPRSRS